MSRPRVLDDVERVAKRKKVINFLSVPLNADEDLLKDVEAFKESHKEWYMWSDGNTAYYSAGNTMNEQMKAYQLFMKNNSKVKL